MLRALNVVFLEGLLRVKQPMLVGGSPGLDSPPQGQVVAFFI